MLPLATILHPTDFSEQSEFAFRLACALARDYKARLVLLHVLPPPMATYAGGLAATADRWHDTDEAKARLQRMEEEAHRVRVESTVMAGDPVDMILRAATETNSDVIVMGTHGRTALGRLLMGSVAESVLRKAPCPVLTSKPFLGRKRIDEESKNKEEVAAAMKGGAECLAESRRPEHGGGESA
jgi:nucleotide-binding universal stress UspA family protein